jgi:hypothetical protein
MHPLDVAELLQEEVERLREQIAEQPALRAEQPALTLDPSPVLTIAFMKVERARLQEVVPTGMFGPGGGQLAVPMHGIDLSSKSERRLILALGCENYDGEPPTAELLDADGVPLPAGQWPKDLIRQGIIDGHRDFDRPFFCRPGLREFHTHPQHEDDPWDAHREALRLHAIVLGLLHDLQARWMLST